MNSLHFWRGGVLSLAALVAVTPLRADLNSDLAFSAFHDVNVDELTGGNVLQKNGGLLSFPRGISTQSLFVINAQPAAVAAKLTHWNPAAHPELKVWLHKSLPAQVTAADFADLANLPDNASVNFQIKSTASGDPGHSGLQLSREEAQIIAGVAQQQKEPRLLFANAWGQILAGRVNAFLAGNGSTAYDASSEGDIHPLDDVKKLLHSDVKVYGNYQRLLNQTPAKALAGNVSAPIKPADLYCDVFDVEGSAAVGTGAIYQAPNGAAIQSADMEYYTNYGVYATVELEEMWPVTVQGRPETLVWRDDLVSAPNIAYLHGTERLASGMIMLQETKQGVQAFVAEFK
jgi:hypothetical protein